MSLTYHTPSAMASAKLHWLLLFPSQSGSHPKVISRLEGTALLTSPSLKSWSLLMFVCEMIFSLVIAVPLAECHIYFHRKLFEKKHHVVWAFAFIASYLFVLYVPWWLHLWLPDLQHFLSSSPGPSPSSLWSVSITLCPFTRHPPWVTIIIALTKSPKPTRSPFTGGHG